MWQKFQILRKITWTFLKNGIMMSGFSNLTDLKKFNKQIIS
jgi:hypothetical protein